MAYILSAFAGAGAQFFDDNGTPLTGGLVYTYSAGTTTPATTYTDSTGANAHSNPIVLDAAGRTPSEIWVDGGLVYKFIVKTSTGTLVGTYDNIPGIDDPTVFNNLIQVTGTNTLLGTATPPINGYVAGATYSFVVPNNNTGAVTISIDGLGAKEITYAGSTPLLANMLVANAIVTIEYDGTRFQLMQSSASVATVASLTVTNNATVGGTTTTAGLVVNGNNISAVNSLGFRNRFINPGMRIAQRATSATITAGSTIAAGYATVDRWYCYSTGANVTMAQVAGSGNTQNRLQITGAASVSAIGVGQRIEQNNSYDLAGGSATLSVDLANSLLTTVTWTAYYANTADTFGTLASPTRTQIATGTFTVNSTVTRYNTNITIPAAATTGIEVVFTVGAQTSGTWTIGDVQLEAGTVATQFERRPYGTELALCQRYFEKSYNQSTVPGTAGLSISAKVNIVTSYLTALCYYTWTVTKRATPSITVYSPTTGASGNASESNNGGTVVADRAINVLYTTDRVFGYQANAGNFTAGNFISMEWVASAEL